MAGKDAIIRLGIEVGDVKRGLDQVQSELKQTAKAASGIKKVDKNLDDLKKTAGNVARGLGVATAAATALGAGLAALTISAFETAAKSEALSKGLAKLAGDGARAEAALQAIMRATNGTVSEMEAMRIANTALSFGIVQNSKELEELATIGVTLGRSLGIDAAKSVEDLTLALSRQSPKILDNLGIQLKLEDAYSIAAKALGKNVEALTEAEKQQAFMNAALIKGREKLEQMGGRVETAADSWLRLKARLVDAKTAFSEGLAQSEGLGASMDELAGAVENLIPKLIEAAEKLAPFTAGLIEFAGGLLDAFTATGAADPDQFADPLTKSMVKIQNQIRDLRAEASQAQKDIDLGKLMGDPALVEESQKRLLDLTLQIKPLDTALEQLEKSRRGFNLAETTVQVDVAEQKFGNTKDTVEELKTELDEVGKILAQLGGDAGRFAELAGQVDQVSTETDEQIELLGLLADGAESAKAALLGLWLDGKINAEQYNTELAAILESEAAIAEQRSAIIAGDRAGFLESIGGGGDVETKMGEGGALGAGGFADFAQGELGAAGQGEQDAFESESGFKLSDILNPAFDVDTAMETWETVTSAMQDGTLGLVDGQNQLAEAGFRVDGALQQSLKSMAKQGKAAKTQAMALNLVGQAAGNLTAGLIQMAISGEGSFKKLLQAELSSIAKSSASKAIQLVAEGFAAKARHDYTAAADAFTAASFYGKVAAIAGVGAIAMGRGGGSGDGEGEREQPGGSTSQDRDIARTQEAADEADRGGPNVAVIFDGASFVGEPSAESLALITSAVEQATANAAGGNSLRGG